MSDPESQPEPTPPTEPDEAPSLTDAQIAAMRASRTVEIAMTQCSGLALSTVGFYRALRFYGLSEPEALALAGNYVAMTHDQAVTFQIPGHPNFRRP